jgi:hypothetical protein
MLWGIADNFRKCDNIKLDLPATNLRNIPWVEEPWMLRLSSRSPNKHRGVAPKSVAAGTPKSDSTVWLVDDESRDDVGADEFLEGLDEDNHHPDEHILEPHQALIGDRILTRSGQPLGPPRQPMRIKVRRRRCQKSVR